MIVRWGLDELPEVLAELGIERPLLVASERWSSLDLPPRRRWHEVPSHRIEAPDDVDGAARRRRRLRDRHREGAVRRASGLPLVSVPTTYSGAEWTPTFGVRDPDRKMVGGGGGAHLAGIVYDPSSPLGLPRAESGGTAMNALAHTRRGALRAGAKRRGRRARARGRAADRGARCRASLERAGRPGAADAPARRRRARRRGARARGARARARDGAGARRHLRAAARGDERDRRCRRRSASTPSSRPRRCGASARRSARRTIRPRRSRSSPRSPGSTRLRDVGVPEDDLPALAEAAAARGREPREPAPGHGRGVEELYRSIW